MDSIPGIRQNRWNIGRETDMQKTLAVKQLTPAGMIASFGLFVLFSTSVFGKTIPECCDRYNDRGANRQGCWDVAF